MWFLTITTALALFTTASAHAVAPSPRARPADILKARQYKPRQLLDVCANIDAELKVDVLGISIVVGILDVCLCISALPTFIETNVIAIAAVDLVGLSKVDSAIEALINAAPDHKPCTYPLHASPLCSASDPCGFTCGAGYTPSPPPPANPTACVAGGPSGAAQRKRDVNFMRSADWEEAVCPGTAYSVCGVADAGRGKQAWECVDTQNDIESCGGCLTPLTPSPSSSTPCGTDCTSLPGVDAVSCLAGACVVHACLPGYSVSRVGDGCVHVSSSSSDAAGLEEVWRASDFGLEHVPLKQ